MRRTLLRAVAGLGVLAVALTACGGVEDTALEASPSTLVTDDGSLVRQYEAPSLLIDRDDPATVYLSAVQLQTGECRFFRSADGGTSWDTELPAPLLEPYTNCSMGSSGPQNIRTELKQAPDGTLLYSFHAHDPDAGGTRSILLGRSTDGGSSWSTTLVHAGTKASTEDDIEVNFEPHIAIDEADPDRVVVTWRRSLPSVSGVGRTRPWMAVSDDGGASFAESFMMFDRDMGFDAPRPVFVDGRLHIFYRIRQEVEDQEVVASLFTAVSDDGGATWEQTPLVATPPDDMSEPVPVYDADAGRFYVTWHDNSTGNLDVWFATSENGTDWSEPRRLNDDPEESTAGQYYPQITLAGAGRLVVAWYDYRDDPYPRPIGSPEEPLSLFGNLGNFHSVYTTTSTDGGATWSPNVRANDVLIDRTIGTWNGDFFVVVPVAVAADADRIVLAWSDTRHGNAETATQDIATSVLTPATGDGGDGALALVVGGVGVILGAGLALVAAALVVRRRGAPAEPAREPAPVG